MNVKNIVRSTVAAIAIAAVTAGAAFAADCGCGKCASGCDCGSECSMPKIAPRK
ncbi:hypothetical protein [Chamaesiphon sp. GL140_3_metabinner_50]|uniref:hypothetical protein n=1 Tax=Chamaesiphon sp. GL140_3_metabinner_50 TaxID=2970812 RepID=UPI0025F97635|nr:hypothetical protein [Chamaesiphon sp. GL140_3_metabinner_50]